MGFLAADGLAIFALVVVAAVLLVAYFAAKAREKGRYPRYAREVYLWAGTGPVPPGAEPATPAQVAVFAAAGGDALLGAGARPHGRGRWLYGPKPRCGARGVAPFDRARWFQPQDRAQG